EYYEPTDVRGQGRLSVMRVVHAYRNMFGYTDNLDAFGESGSCNNNVACDDEWNDQERGVVMLLTSGGWRYCSGSLINNTNNDGTPYVLTANHCSPAATDVAMFNYQSPTCTPNTDGPTTQTVSGTTTRFNNSTSDGWLMELSSPVPLTYNPYFNGWNANDVAASASVGIHHPSGDVKKISWDNDPTTSTSYLGEPIPGDGTHWRITAWDDGTTEGGSSGSPLFDTDYRITGQLHGGYASCTSITSDWYGKFSLSMTLGARTYLDPSSSGIMTLDGYDPNVAGRVLGVVRDSDSNEPIQGVLVAAVGGGSTTTNGLGEYTLPLPDGTWDIDYTKRGYEPQSITGIVITEGSEETRNVLMQSIPLIMVMNEDFESGASGWTHEANPSWVDNWHLSTEDAHNGNTSYKCGDTGTGNYSNLCDARLISPVLTSLPGDAEMTFAMRIESEISSYYPDSAYDGGIIEMSVNGGAFAQVTPEQNYTKRFRYTSGGGSPVSGPMPGLFCFAGDAPTWLLYSVDLTDYEGDDVQFRFRFGSDAGAADEGWYIDDVQVKGYGVNLVDVTGLTITVTGNDVTLRWEDDTNPYYRIYSSDVSEGVFIEEEGSTSANEFTIGDGATEEIRFYYVVGASAP
ncbi:carboxypeptidase regulatory-like domain-containing protein, partial [bacterium]|nr:carboxypeptidase regulatory-like domain-containing protein [bacterium]